MTAFIQPDGTFHISGNQIICNVCGTTWDFQTLKGISGGCQTYPPQALPYSLNGDNLEIPQTELDAWAPKFSQKMLRIKKTWLTPSFLYDLGGAAKCL
ncbi:MAG TPA: Fe-S-containing protein [Desulfosporosinus sp.]|nr:Fe-S-containing protein [Desulfosporosinus sp.]